MAVAVYKPSAIALPGGTQLTQFEQPFQFDPGYDHLSITPPGATAPSFTGNNVSAPKVSGSTSQIKDVLDLVTVDSIASGLSGNIDLEYHKVNNTGTRDAYTALSHVRLRAALGLFWWEGLSARGTDPASIDFAMHLLSSDGTTAPVAKSSGVALTASPVVQHVFGLGGMKVNTSFVCLDSMDWRNNVTVPDPKTCDGNTYPTFAYVENWAPVVTIETEDIDTIMNYLPDGQSMPTCSWFLRKRKQGGGNEANASLVHINLTATAGTVKPGSNSNQLEFHLHNFSLSTASAIS